MRIVELLPTNERDLEAIVELHNSHLLSLEDLHSQAQFSGFLVAGMTVDRLKTLLAQPSCHALIALSAEEKVVGYTLGSSLVDYGMRKPAKKEALLSILGDENIPDEKIFYHSYIATRSEEKGVGSVLLDEQIRFCQQNGYVAMVCRIVHKPVKNQISASFHEMHGFRCLGEEPAHLYKGNMVGGVYVREI